LCHTVTDHVRLWRFWCVDEAQLIYFSLFNDQRLADFGGLAPTTPLVRVKERNLARTTKPNSRADPGPSTKPASGPPKAGRKNTKAPPSNNSDIEEVTVVENVVNGDTSRAPPRARKPPPRTAAPTLNGKQKGKAKAVLRPARQKSAEFETIDDDVDRIEILDEMDDDEEAQPATPIGTANKRRRKNADWAHHVKDDETSRLAEQLHRVSSIALPCLTPH
jgi:hypothetical protein